MTTKRAVPTTPAESAPVPPTDGLELPTIGDVVLVRLAHRDGPLPAIVTGLPGPGPYAIACEVFGTDNGSHRVAHLGCDPQGIDVPSWRPRA